MPGKKTELLPIPEPVEAALTEVLQSLKIDLNKLLDVEPKNGTHMPSDQVAFEALTAYSIIGRCRAFKRVFVSRLDPLENKLALLWGNKEGPAKVPISRDLLKFLTEDYKVESDGLRKVARILKCVNQYEALNEV